MDKSRKEYNEIIHNQSGKELVQIETSIIKRVNFIKELIGELDIKKTGYDIGVIRIKHEEADIVVATVYSYKNVAKYVSYTYTMISADGEYRPVFVAWKQIVRVYKDEAKHIEDLEKEIIKMVSRKNVYTVGYIPDRGKVYLLMSIAIILFTGDNPFLFNNRGVSLEVIIKKYCGKASDIIMNNFAYYRKILSRIIALVPKLKYMFKKVLGWSESMLGNKLIPLNIYDIEHMGTVRSKIWKELVITKECEKLLVNGCCEELCFIPDWFITNKANKNIFNNEVTIQHYEKSEEILNSVSHLYSAKKLEINSTYGNLYNDYINIPIKYAERHLVKTNRVFNIVSEFRGTPLADYGTISVIKSIPDHYKDYLIYENVTAFKAMIFKYMYGLAAINRLGIIHGDLHLNNVLAKVNFNIYRRDLSFSKPGKSSNKLKYYHLYAIYHMKDKTFLLPSIIQLTIIDFSRSLIMPHKLRDMMDNYEEIISSQKGVILQIFRTIIPEWTANNEKLIKHLILSNEKSIYQILTATDILFMIEQFKFHNQKKIKLPVMKSINHLLRTGIDWIKNQFKELDMKVDHKVPNFNREYILKHFTEFERTIPQIKKEIAARSGKELHLYPTFINFDKMDISGVYNLDNELTYNLDEYDKLPSFITKEYKTLEPEEWLKTLRSGLKRMKERNATKELNKFSNEEMEKYDKNTRQK